MRIKTQSYAENRRFLRRIHTCRMQTPDRTKYALYGSLRTICKFYFIETVFFTGVMFLYFLYAGLSRAVCSGVSFGLFSSYVTGIFF